MKKAYPYIISFLTLNFLYTLLMYSMKFMEESETSQTVSLRITKDQLKDVEVFAKSLGLNEDQIITSTADIFLTLPGFIMNLVGLVMVILPFLFIHKKVNKVLKTENNHSEQTGQPNS